MKKILFASFILCGIALQAQRFHGGILAGGNLSQIDGDLVYGFNQLGWHGGAFVGTKIGKRSDLDVQFIYSTRGSRSKADDLDFIKIRLNYIDIPILYTLKDWENEDEKGKYYRMHFFGGLSLGRLISSESNKNYHNNFKNNDLSWIAGFEYFFSRNAGFHGRYTRSFTPIYKYSANNTAYSMISYFISLGLVYRFN